MASVRAIARHIGLSAATVSRALAGRGEVAAATRARVLRAAAELGRGRLEVPAGDGRTLLLLQRDTVADDPLSQAWARALVEGLGEGVASLSARLAILACDDLEEEQAVDARTACARARLHPSGLILWGWEDTRAIDRLAQSMPCVSLTRVPTGAQVAEIGFDHEHAVEVMVRRLLDLGHRRLGVVGGIDLRRRASERLGAVVAALHHRRFADPMPALVDDHDPEAGRRLVQATRDGVTAWIAASHLAGLRTLSLLEEAGLGVPRQVSVIGFLAAVSPPGRPELGGMRGPFHAIGRAAAAQLLGPRDRVRIGYRLLLQGIAVPGATVGPPPGP